MPIYPQVRSSSISCLAPSPSCLLAPPWIHHILWRPSPENIQHIRRVVSDPLQNRELTERLSTSCPIKSHEILSNPIQSHSIPSNLIQSNPSRILNSQGNLAKIKFPHKIPLKSHPILSNPIQSYPILSNPIQSYLILSNPIQSYLTLSNPIQSYPILSNPI